jgi:hypothetical protein
MASAIDRRKAQNRGVKAGTVRVGAGGKTVRRYNAKTGRWDVTKKDVKATGTTLRPVKSSSTTTTSDRKRGGYAGGQTSYTPTKTKTTVGNKTYPNLTLAKKSSEGPKVGKKDTSSGFDRFARKGLLAAVFDRGTGRVTTNRASDFPKGTPLQLVKSRNKDSQGRDVYRYVKVSKTK